MKVIIAGSRRITSDGVLGLAMLGCGFHVTEVVSGAARGVDRSGELWAKTRGIPVVQVFAEWGHFGNRAGHMRNVDMARRSDALVALWDGHSTGTRHMIVTMLQMGKPVAAFILRVDSTVVRFI